MDASIERSIAFLYGLQRHGIKPGLDQTLALLSALGDPQRAFPAIHVGGTNGKGSTAAMVAALLASQGYRVGLYTSPHLVDFSERIQINGHAIPSEWIRELTECVRTAAESHLAEPPTFFEATTVVAFAYFAEMRVEHAVVEVGLGGRCDATNVIAPLVSIITTIGLDHQEYLGDTLEAIAFEKAGIIKHGTPVVVGRVGEGPLSVIRAAAAQRQASCAVLGRDFDTTGEGPGCFAYRGLRWRDEGLACPLPGRHQLDNAACALAALEMAAGRGVRVSAMRLPPSVHGRGDHGFVPGLIGIARAKGLAAYVGDGSNRWAAVHRLDAARLFRLALESAPAGTRLHAVGDEGVPFRDIAAIIGRHLDLPVTSISREEADAHFGGFALFASMDVPSSSAITRQRFGWHPVQPGLIADLDEGHYFS